jgi:hypothetical protein
MPRTGCGLGKRLDVIAGRDFQLSLILVRLTDAVAG